ncbi:MAG: hypothetical protein A2X46_00725 [Lentisphaerae bacterium GWF2_57_35]|nr:MAG: hypothetical protein A2X46_00725 [Lentisphaerae bacterium GWF2_57_35]
MSHTHFSVNANEYQECRLCPRQCDVNRSEGQRGYCQETAVCRIASVGPHFGEEPSFSGRHGSGAFFFSGCSSRCIFCQNYQISLENKGYEVDEAELFRLALSLIGQGVHNLNFVTPDHFWPHIRTLCENLRARGETIPFLLNCSGYQEPAMIEAYARLIDIFMPDFKFADPQLAGQCMHDARYPVIALESLRKMIELNGFLTPWDPTGQETARHGVLVRHLVLPGCVENSLNVLRQLAAEFGRKLPLSIMSQFEPIPNCETCRLFTTRVAAADYRRVCDEVESLGFENVYIQPDLGDMDFMPDFNRDEPFDGNKRDK